MTWFQNPHRGCNFSLQKLWRFCWRFWHQKEACISFRGWISIGGNHAHCIFSENTDWIEDRSTMLQRICSENSIVAAAEVASASMAATLLLNQFFLSKNRLFFTQKIQISDQNLAWSQNHQGGCTFCSNPQMKILPRISYKHLFQHSSQAPTGRRPVSSTSWRSLWKAFARACNWFLFVQLKSTFRLNPACFLTSLDREKWMDEKTTFGSAVVELW